MFANPFRQDALLNSVALGFIGSISDPLHGSCKHEEVVTSLFLFAHTFASDMGISGASGSSELCDANLT